MSGDSSGADGLELFLDDLREMLDYGDDDRRRILASAGLLLPHTVEILDRVYGVLLRIPSTRRYFAGPDGEVAESYMEKRRKTLFEWLAQTARGALDVRLGTYIDEVAIHHLEREAGREPVPLPPIEALFGVLLVEFQRHLAAAISDPAERQAAVASWMKMMAAQQALFARAYARAPSPRA